MKNIDYKIADPNHPFVGLNNKNCRHPKHWCKFHKVWLSDRDVKYKQCLCKQSDDGTYVCPALMQNCYKKSIDCMLKKTRPTRNKSNERYY